MFLVGDEVKIIANLKDDDYACDDLIDAIGTIISSKPEEDVQIYCISFDQAYDSTWWEDESNPYCRWVLENEIQSVVPMETLRTNFLNCWGVNDNGKIQSRRQSGCC